MRVCVLGSSSSGNATFVSDGETRVLIDTGALPILKYIQPALAEIGEDWNDLDAILVSHRHTDHLHGNTFSIAHRTRTPVYVKREVKKWLEGVSTWPHLPRCIADGLVRTMDGSISIGGLEVRTFALPHDSAPTVGFVLTGRGGRRVGVATDLGHCPARVAKRLCDCDVLVFEANHDESMEWDSGRGLDLIERNLGPRGHLSNHQSGEALCEIIGRSRRLPTCVFLAHISRDCNRPDLACRAVTDELERYSLDDVRIEPTFPRTRSALAEV